MGAWMAKFICKEVETMDDYEEYCHYVTGPIGIGMFKIFESSGKQDFAPENLSSIMGVFLQKTNIIRDYLEDISEIPKPRMFWPREVWSKYVNKLENLKYDENSVKAVQCLNEMITDALKHVEDCLKHMSALKDYEVFRFCAIRPVLAIGTLAFCYNNIDVFKTGVKLRPGLVAKIYDRTKMMTDVYNAFFEFASVMKSKVEMHDPHSMETLSRLNNIQDICRESGLLNNRKFYIIRREQRLYNFALFMSAKFAFFPPSLAIYRIKKSENGKLTVVSSSSSMPIPLADDSSLDVLLIDTNRGNKIVAFYLKNPYARLTLLYSHGNDVDFSRFL
ncbi:hypothetical protein LWI28_013528 [Acer negundo]|uniref:Squalene synthase n=1 Tax=Acer negundo TaxID=4023 RepID=A0AAD5P367_ACENE|nr:hypothetical protein LWI28_013528 [Acer negundo]